MRHVAEKTGGDLEELYEKITWPLSDKYGHAYDAFKIAITEPDSVFSDMGIEDSTLFELKSNISRRLTPQPVKIRADIEVTCFGYEGIEAIKAALKAGEALQTPEIPIKVKLVAPPLYVMTTNSSDKRGGIDLLEKAILTIEETVKKTGGDVNVKMKPKAVSENEDAELEALMAAAERENAEVSGDEESDAE